MTLYDLIQAMEEVALRQPAVRSVVSHDPYRLNGLKDVKYGVFAWSQLQHEIDMAGSSYRFVFNLFYIDRLTADMHNMTEVQSVGMEVLENIIRTLFYTYDVGVGETVTVQPFEQKFVDLCAGAYATVTFEVPVETICETEYGV